MVDYIISKKTEDSPCKLEITGEGDIGQKANMTIFARSCDDVKIDMDNEIPGSAMREQYVMLLGMDANEFMKKTTEFFRVCGCLTPHQATNIRRTLDQKYYKKSEKQ